MKASAPLAVLALTCAFALPVRAATPPPMPDAGFCEEYKERCQEMKQHRADFCRSNPQTCETAKEARQEKHDAKKDYCDENPAKCKKLREERAARQDKVEDACKAHPKACEKKKEQVRQARHERREAMRTKHHEPMKQDETGEDTSRRP